MSAHHENCDVNDRNPDGITKPCNCRTVGRELAAMPGSSTFDPMCWDHETRLDGDGVFNLTAKYMNCQAPPMMGVQTIHMDKWPDGTTCHRKTFAVLRRTQSGAREHQPMSVAETLWQALLSFCMERCHIIHYDMRGGHRIRIESGNHDAKQWQFRGASWEQVTKKAVLTMMPGYWTNASALAVANPPPANHDQ